MDNEIPKRKSNRKKNYDYSNGGAYFLTICTRDRINLFWEKVQPNPVGADIIRPQAQVALSAYGRIAEKVLLDIPKHYRGVELLQYTVMPNHIHLVLFLPYENGRMISAPTVSTIIGQMKRSVSKKIGFHIWQKSFHDHIIRNKRDYDKIAEYV